MAARKKKKEEPADGEVCSCGEVHGTASPEDVQNGALAVAQSAKLNCAINHWDGEDFIVMIAVAHHMVEFVTRADNKGELPAKLQRRIDNAVAYAMQCYEKNESAEKTNVNATGSGAVN